MAERDCVGIRDPNRISGNIYATKSEGQRYDRPASVKSSRDHAKRRWLRAQRTNKRSGRQQWELLF